METIEAPTTTAVNDEYFITNKHTMDNKYVVHPYNNKGASAITGSTARLMLCGGKNRNCDCYGRDGHGVSIRNKSCKHVAGAIVRSMKLRGWKKEECLEIACYSDTFPGLAYFTKPDFGNEYNVDVFERFWDNTKVTRSYETEEKQKGDGFTFHFKIWNRILNYLQHRPAAGVNELKRAMGIWHGVTDRYILEGIERGYIEKKTFGRGRKAQLFCIGFPSAPVVTQPSKRHNTFEQNQFWKLINATFGLKELTHEERIEKVKSGELVEVLMETYDTITYSKYSITMDTIRRCAKRPFSCAIIEVQPEQKNREITQENYREIFSTWSEEDLQHFFPEYYEK